METQNLRPNSDLGQMKRLLVYTLAISAGIFGFVPGIIGAIWLGIEQPALSLFAGLVGIAIGVATGFVTFWQTRQTSRSRLAKLAFAGVFIFVMALAFYWTFLIH